MSDANDARANDARANDAPAGGVSRRRVLQVLGLAAGGVAAGAGCKPDTGAHPADSAHAANAGANPAPPPAGAAPQTFFTPHERETVNVLVDYVIPKDERSGSATDAGVPAWMDAFLSDPDTEDAFRARVRGGLAWLDAECDRRFGAAATGAAATGAAAVTFARATDAQRRQVLDDIAYPARARPAMSHGVAFFNTFRDFTASGFFSSRLGHEDLRYMGNAAVPVWDGCPPAALQHLGVNEQMMTTRVPPSTSSSRS
jgi:hypothetical protein